MEQIIIHAIDTTRDISLAYINYLYFYTGINDVADIIVMGGFLAGALYVMRCMIKWE